MPTRQPWCRRPRAPGYPHIPRVVHSWLVALSDPAEYVPRSVRWNRYSIARRRCTLLVTARTTSACAGREHSLPSGAAPTWSGTRTTVPPATPCSSCAALAELAPHAVASHVSALVVHGLPVWGLPLDRAHVTFDRRTGGRVDERLHVHTAPLHPDDVAVVDGVAVTSRARAVVDVGRRYGFEPAVAVADAALRVAGSGVPRASGRRSTPRCAVRRAGRAYPPRGGSWRSRTAGRRAWGSRAAGWRWRSYGPPGARAAVPGAPRVVDRVRRLRVAAAAHRGGVRRQSQVRPAAEAWSGRR